MRVTGLFSRVVLVFVALLPALGTLGHERPVSSPEKPSIKNDGTVQIPAFEIPLSIYMSEEAKRAYINERLHPPANTVQPKSMAEAVQRIVEVRESTDRIFLLPLLNRAKARFPAVIEEKELAGVHVYSVKPKDGILEQNRRRILINLHGGGFMVGSHTLQLIESIPLAATAGIEVISVDYRMAPEHSFPAASQDVAAVYAALLKRYAPENIGIVGSSAGGALTMMSVAWFQRHGLPRPAAIALLSSSLAVSGGDSRYFAAPLNPLFGDRGPSPPATPNPPPAPIAVEYLAGANLEDPLVSPASHPDVLAGFPPTLLATGTRDFLASSTLHIHRQLLRAGANADLHVWDGMWHSFYQDVDIPESRELYQLMAKFFDAHLGK